MNKRSGFTKEELNFIVDAVATLADAALVFEDEDGGELTDSVAFLNGLLQRELAEVSG